jgi:hypothetical protein
VNLIVGGNVAREARLHTDESRIYSDARALVAAHEAARHSAGEYARDDAHTNSVEGFFSVFKRGMRGVFRHCAEKHLHRYLAEFDFRYNNRVGPRRGRRHARRGGAAGRGRQEVDLPNGSLRRAPDSSKAPSFEP